MSRKKEFFILYNNVKKGIIDISDLMINDMINIELMMQNEIRIIDEKTEQLEAKITEQEQKINILKNKKY